MGEVLCRYKGLAPWIGMAITVLSGIALNVAVISYSYGQLQQRQLDFDRRLAAIEKNDHEQTLEMSALASQLARIGEGVAYIREAVRERKGQ